MPKLKTHKGTAKRVTVTSTGKVKRKNSRRIHFLEKQSGGRQRALATKSSIVGKIRKNIKRALGV